MSSKRKVTTAGEPRCEVEFCPSPGAVWCEPVGPQVVRDGYLPGSVLALNMISEPSSGNSRDGGTVAAVVGGRRVVVDGAVGAELLCRRHAFVLGVAGRVAGAVPVVER